MISLHICAPNDNNGNPRRCFVVIDDAGNVVEAIDEGYDGQSAVTDKYPDAKLGPKIEVTPSEYRSWLREHGKGRKRK